MDIGSIKSVSPNISVRDAATPAMKAVETVSAVQTPAASSRDGADRKQLEQAVATIQEFVQASRRNINFAVDDGSGRVLVKVTDAGSGDVIRQIPSEEALRLAENLTEARSLLFQAEA